jgi:hypothetical protein
VTAEREDWWQTLLKAAIEIWSTRVTLKALDRGASGDLAWWDMLRRWASALAYRFGRMAIYAENRYNEARA